MNQIGNQCSLRNAITSQSVGSKPAPNHASAEGSPDNRLHHIPSSNPGPSTAQAAPYAKSGNDHDLPVPCSAWQPWCKAETRAAVAKPIWVSKHPLRIEPPFHGLSLYSLTGLRCAHFHTKDQWQTDRPHCCFSILTVVKSSNLQCRRFVRKNLNGLLIPEALCTGTSND